MGQTTRHGNVLIKEESESDADYEPFRKLIVPDGGRILEDADAARLIFDPTGTGTAWVEVAVSAYADMATAVSTIGATPATLVIDSAETVSTALVVPATLYLRFAKGALLTKSGSGTIEFEGLGLDNPDYKQPLFSGFAAGDITWTGTVYPLPISTEWWNTANDSLTDRVNRADLSVVGKYARIIGFERTITSTATLNEHHHLYLNGGDYESTLNTFGGTHYPAFLIKSNTSISGPTDHTARLYEPANDGSGIMIHAYHTRSGGGETTGMQEKMVVEYLHFVGHPDNVDSYAGNSTVSLGNCWHSAIRHCIFERTHYYAAVIGFYGTDGNYAFDSEIHDNKFLHLGTQIAVILNGKSCRITNNYFRCTDTEGTSTYTIIDIEPNIPQDVMEDILIAENELDCRDITDGSKYVNAIWAQASLLGSIKNLTIRDNEIYGADLFPVPATLNPLTVGMYIYGVFGLKMHDNFVRSAFQMGYRIERSRRAEIHHNIGEQCSDVVGDNIAMELIAVADSNIHHNIFSENPLQPARQSTGILEKELEHTVTTSGSTIAVNVNLGLFRIVYDLYKGLTVTINNTDYTISAWNSDTSLTTSVSIGTLAQKTFVDANVTVGTENIAITAHGHNTGSRIWLSTTGTVPAGLSPFRSYFVIRVDADNLKLANTLADALANTPVNITAAAGGGTHTLTPVMLTKFSNNEYWRNKTDDGLFLEPTGTSRQRPLDAGEMPDVTGDVSIEAGVSVIEDHAVLYSKLPAGPVPSLLGYFTGTIYDPVTWQNTVAVTISGADNKLTSTGSGWNTSGAYSVESFPDDGKLTFTATESDKSRLVGLSTTDPDANYVSIDYGIHLNASAALFVFENSVNVFSAGSYVANTTVLEIRRVGTEITYWKDGTLVYTSLVSSTGDLHVDVAIETNGATVGGVILTDTSTADVGATADPIVNSITIGTAKDLHGTGSPEGAVTAPVGSTFHRTDGGTATSFYIKESGSGNTGWVAVGGVSAVVISGDYGAADGSLPTGVEGTFYRNTNASSKRLFLYNASAFRTIFQAGIDLINLTSNVTGTLPIANGGTANTSIAYTTLTDGATITWTVSGIVNNAKVTLGGNRTLAFSGLASGMSGTLIVIQDGAGSRGLTLPANSKVIDSGGGAITLSTAAGAVDILSWTTDGTSSFWTFGKTFT